MKKVGTRIAHWIPTPELKGVNVVYKVKLQYEDLYYVSPAIYELMQDDDVKDEVMKNVGVVTISDLEWVKMKNKNKRKTTKKKKDELD